MNTRFSKRLVASAIATALTSQVAMAQDAKPTKENTEVIVVSGTPGGAGIRKIDASFRRKSDKSHMANINPNILAKQTTQ